MKKVITTVGTSIFTNYQKEYDDLNDKLSDLIDKKFENNHLNNNRDVNAIRKTIKEKWLNKGDASAEVTSILKIFLEENDQLDIYLLATDTVLSALAAELIVEYFKDDKDIKIYFNPDLDVINGLQVKDRKEFVRGGLPNLVNRISQIAGGYYDNVIFNITGGYKGVIPYLTIMATIYSSEIKYVFEKSDELITIPELPIKIDENIFDKYEDFIVKLENGIENYQEEKNEHYEAYEKLEKSGLVEFDEELAFLSPIGEIFYRKYKSNFFIFYATDDVFSEIQKQKNIQKILSTSFEKNLDSKTEQKNSHTVYDDGNNQFRIFYFKVKEKIHIYKTFENHDEYEKYLNKNECTQMFKENYMRNAKIRKIKKWRVS